MRWYGRYHTSSLKQLRIKLHMDSYVKCPFCRIFYCEFYINNCLLVALLSATICTVNYGKMTAVTVVCASIICALYCKITALNYFNCKNCSISVTGL